VRSLFLSCRHFFLVPARRAKWTGSWRAVVAATRLEPVGVEVEEHSERHGRGEPERGGPREQAERDENAAAELYVVVQRRPRVERAGSARQPAEVRREDVLDETVELRARDPTRDRC
jgi:hypothetical protein